jgi:hypothetical protein
MSISVGATLKSPASRPLRSVVSMPLTGGRHLYDGNANAK